MNISFFLKRNQIFLLYTLNADVSQEEAWGHFYYSAILKGDALSETIILKEEIWSYDK